jgi:ankyrin repeat protein
MARPSGIPTGEPHVRVVQALRSYGAELDAKNDADGNTPLHLACSNEHLAVVNELMSPNDSNGTPTILGKRKSRVADIGATDNMSSGLSVRV